MLAPDSRLTLLDALRPPAGYRLGCAVGTTFSLNLDAALTAPAAFALHAVADAVDQREVEPLELLDSIRRHAGLYTVFFQAGQIPVPTQRRLFAYLEGALVPVTAPGGGVFHPKVWVLRFDGPDASSTYRLLCASRNLTLDRSWDTILRLDSLGTDEPTQPAFDGAGLTRFVRALPDLAVGGLAESRRVRILELADALDTVTWALPPQVEAGRCIPIGLDGPVKPPFPPMADHVAVISPFLTSSLLTQLPACSGRRVLVSRPDQLDACATAAQGKFNEIYALDPDATPVAEVTPGTADTSDDPRDATATSAEDPGVPFEGLHAKVFVFDRASTTTVLTGSANATTAAFSANVEFACELTGSRRALGVDTLMAEPAKEIQTLRSFLVPHLFTDGDETDEGEDLAEDLLDQLRRSIAAVPITARAIETDGDRFDLAFTTEATMPPLDSGIDWRCWPVTLNEASATNVVDRQPLDVRFPVSFEGITAFLANELRLGDTVTHFVLTAELVESPANRDTRLLRILLGDAERFLRYLLMLLSDAAFEPGGLADLLDALEGAEGGAGSAATAPSCRLAGDLELAGLDSGGVRADAEGDGIPPARAGRDLGANLGSRRGASSVTAIPPADEVLSTLRAFQRRTATYAFSRLFHPEAPSVRFLVADEVGLGKTLVARGVIAQVVDHLSGLGDKRVDIVYICSNAAIARQNLRKLNIAGPDAVVEADRFTMLTNEVHRLEKRSLNLVAVTPGTSLEFGSSAGKFPERALLYAVLQRVWGEDAMRGSGAERVFYLGIRDDKTARRRLRDKAAQMRPSSSVIRAFRQQIRRLNEERRLADRPTLRVEFNRLASTFHYKDGYTQRDRDHRNRFIVELRQALATVGIEALQPDLVILDEFQRFRSLLDRTNQSWATRLAHELFDYREPSMGRPTRTLLLSATPYRPYTTADDAEGDNHFEDFLATAHFLLDDDLAAEALGDDLRDLRRSLLVLDRDGGATAALACQRVGDRLRPVMARTERLASTPDRNGMLADTTSEVSLERTDIDGYLTAAHAADLLGQRDVVEYWKSGPYLLNFMEGYALKHAFDDLADGGPAPAGLRDLIEQGKGLLDWGEVTEYGKVHRANARLRALSADTIGRGMWQLLWLPPALPYYDADDIFDTGKARTFTKRLVFSSWHLVPKVISALLSYEAEQAMFDAAGELDTRAYDGFSQRPDRRLDFRVNAETGRLEGMPVLLLVVPFVELARLADPLALASGIGGKERPRRTEVEAAARAAITAALGPLVTGRTATGQVDQRWYWAAPLLFDREADPERTNDWWSRAAWPSLWSADPSDDATGGAFYRHLEAAQDLLEGDDEPLGRVPDDLVDVLVAAALAGPAMCALRSLWRITESSDDRDPMILAAAARTAWGFRSLLNGPDATAVVRAATGIDVHWRAVLEYGMVGHLQAVLDEYLHVLKDWRGFLSDAGPSIVSDLAETAVSALSLRTVNYVADIPRIDNGGVAVDRHTMRGRFAIRFGDQAIEGEQRQQRAQQASHAFNSPFWPFVLTTTSIGQEGLDFHLYSHAVVHWNIPSNPVDFEQREGRVHRYKGHAIRKNVAHACRGAAFADPATDPWAAMFDDAAARGDTDGELQPYWVFHPDGAPARIERHVPVLPLSRDASKLDRLLKAVATYRLSFGQPRQEELVSYLAGRVPDDELAAIIDRLKVDLTPAEIS